MQHMLDRANATELMSQKKFFELVDNFNAIAAECRSCLKRQLEEIKNVLSQQRRDEAKALSEKISKLNLFFMRHVKSMTAMRRIGTDQNRNFRRGMFSFEERFNIEVLNAQSRVWRATNAQWEKEKAIQRLLIDSISLRHIEQVFI